MSDKKPSSTSEKKMDTLDIKIIKTLLQNSRKPLFKIANDCKVSTVTINNRVNELKKRGVIVGSSVIVDYAHVGAQGLGILSINVNPNQLNDFIRDIQGMKGDFFFSQQKLRETANIIVISMVKNIRDVERLKDSIKQHSAVISIETNIWTYMKVDPANLDLEE